MELSPRTSLDDFLKALASGEPVPGGGSAAALAGAMGASLVAMVARLTLGHKGYEGAQAIARDCLTSGEDLGRRLEGLVSEDTDAYRSVAAAFALPRGTDAEKAERRRRIDQALARATEIPRRTAEACLQVLRDADALAPVGNRNAASDIGVAGLVAHAGMVGALMNVEINLNSLGDRIPKDLVVPPVGKMREEGGVLLTSILDHVRRRMSST